MSERELPEEQPSLQKSNPQKKSFKEFIIDHSVIFFLLAMAASFAVGFGAYDSILKIANLDKVQAGTYLSKEDILKQYTLKDDIIGQYTLRESAVSKIEDLIKDERDLDGNDKKVAWLSRVIAFIHGIELEKDFVYEGQKMSAIETDIRNALKEPKIEVQVQKTLSILRGFSDALQTRVSSSKR